MAELNLKQISDELNSEFESESRCLMFGSTSIDKRGKFEMFGFR